MRTLPLLTLLAAASWADGAFGTWKTKTLTVRFEPHVKGEVFTLDKIDRDGRITTSSTILYFDGKARDFQDSACSGTQSSRRVDGQTVEILRKCGNGGQRQLIRRSSVQPGVLILEILEQNTDGRRSESRLVLEKQ